MVPIFWATLYTNETPIIFEMLRRKQTVHQATDFKIKTAATWGPQISDPISQITLTSQHVGKFDGNQMRYLRDKR